LRNWTTKTKRKTLADHTTRGACMPLMLNNYKTSPPQSHLGRAVSPLLTAENGLARCVC